jgi:Tc toxin complex TcA C-terminal TcB-binding domain
VSSTEPFEGAGAVSTWRLELPEQLRAFDYQTISDVVVHLSYSTLDDAALRDTVQAGLIAKLTQYASTTGLYRLLSLRHDFPAAWQQLMGATGATAGSTGGFAVTGQHFPYFLAQRAVTLDSVQLLLLSQQEASGGGLAKAPVNTSGLAITLNSTAAGARATAPDTGLAAATAPVSGAATGAWSVAVTAGQLDTKQVGDVLMQIRYKVA